MLHTIQSQPRVHKNYPKMVCAQGIKYAADTQTEVRYNSRSNPYTGAQASSIARRNARERSRVKQVNDGFNALRKKLPAAVVAALSAGPRRGSGNKLSKVDTLKMVVEYIKYLQNIIEDNDAASGTCEKTSYDYEGAFTASSPYSAATSPASSDCSSGVSSAYSNCSSLQTCEASAEQLSIHEEDELLDALSWWQER